MRLTRLELVNFRSYTKARYDIGELMVFVGPNGVGKTNVLEAISLLSTGVSPRASKIEQMVNWGEEVGSVTGIVEQREGEELQYQSLAVVVTRGVVLGHRTPKRRYLVDGVAKTRAKLVGRLPSILFRPEDMRLVEGSPSRRRQYLDETLCTMSPDYARSISVYDSSLRQRNRLLVALREGRASRAQFAYWDQSLVKHGEIITAARRRFILSMADLRVPFGEYKVEYDDSAISPARLKQYEREEVLVGHTLVGPHKDDIKIWAKSRGGSEIKELMVYGSRGEQRLGVLFLKMSALKFVEQQLGAKPILLLDDIFSELDDQHRQEILHLISSYQCIITTAEEDVLTMLPSGAKIVRL